MARLLTLAFAVLPAILCALPFALLWFRLHARGLAMIVARVPYRWGRSRCGSARCTGRSPRLMSRASS